MNCHLLKRICQIRLKEENESFPCLTEKGGKYFLVRVSTLGDVFSHLYAVDTSDNYQTIVKHLYLVETPGPADSEYALLLQTV